jgi:hypothetical protein
MTFYEQADRLIQWTGALLGVTFALAVVIGVLWLVAVLVRSPAPAAFDDVTAIFAADRAHLSGWWGRLTTVAEASRHRRLNQTR